MRRAILAAAVMAGAAEAARLPHQPLGFVHTTGRAAATTAGRSHPIQRSAMTTMTMTPGLDGAADGLSLTAASATSLYLAAGDLNNLEVSLGCSRHARRALSLAASARSCAILANTWHMGSHIGWLGKGRRENGLGLVGCPHSTRSLVRSLAAPFRADQCASRASRTALE